MDCFFSRVIQPHRSQLRCKKGCSPCTLLQQSCDFTLTHCSSAKHLAAALPAISSCYQMREAIGLFTQSSAHPTFLLGPGPTKHLLHPLVPRCLGYCLVSRCASPCGLLAGGVGRGTAVPVAAGPAAPHLPSAAVVLPDQVGQPVPGIRRPRRHAVSPYFALSDFAGCCESRPRCPSQYKAVVVAVGISLSESACARVFFFSCLELTLRLVLILPCEVSLFCALLPFSAVGVIQVEQ